MSLHSLAAEKLIRVFVEISETQSLGKLVSRFKKDGERVSKSSPMIKKTMKQNPNILNWKKIPEGVRVKLYLQRSITDKKKLRAFLIDQREKRRHWSLTSAGGSINVANENSETLDFNFIKFGIKYSNILKRDISYYTTISTVKFINLAYSEAAGSTTYESFLPEFSIGISKSLTSKLYLALGYDYLNYFITAKASPTTVSIAPSEIHRIALKPFYSLSNSLGVLSSIGYVSGNATGIDASVGLNYSFWKHKRASIALIGYTSSLTVEELKESSQGFIMSLGVKI